nr:hypothetical protein [Sphingomonas sp. SCN 67-18]
MLSLKSAVEQNWRAILAAGMTKNCPPLFPFDVLDQYEDHGDD